MSSGTRGQPWMPATDSPVPHLLFKADVWRKLMTYVRLCPIEINGFGYVERVGSDLFVVEDVFILEQQATNVSVEVPAEVLMGHIDSMVANGQDPGKMRLQWHSHVEMQAYFSATDTGNIEAYDNEWMISLVVNKFGDFEARLDLYRPFRVHIPLTLGVDLPADEALTRTLSAEIRKKVRTLPVHPLLRRRNLNLRDVGDRVPGVDGNLISIGEVPDAR